MNPSPEPEKAVPVVAWKAPSWNFYPTRFAAVQNCEQVVDALIRLTDHEAAMAALRAEVERPRADAERYRWLRVGGIGRAGVYLNGWKEGDELDATIDAAITAAHGAQGDSNAE